MIETIDDFVKYIPTARGTRFEDIAPFVAEGLLWSQTDIFGEGVTDAIHGGGDGTAMRLLNSIVALKAYSGAIPFLDVVQTSNGFAVVNNSNHAPASRERVERLLGFVNERLYYHVDSLIEHISDSPSLMSEWRRFERFEYLTELLYWTGAEFSQYCGDFEKVETNSPRVTMSYKGGAALRVEAEKRKIPRLELGRLHGVLKGFQENEIGAWISRDYLYELVDKNRLRTLNAEEKALVDRLRFLLGLFVQNEDGKAKEGLDDIVNMMMRRPEKYVSFAGSEEYRLKLAARYENRRGDATYFWG